MIKRFKWISASDQVDHLPESHLKDVIISILPVAEIGFVADSDDIEEAQLLRFHCRDLNKGRCDSFGYFDYEVNPKVRGERAIDRLRQGLVRARKEVGVS